MSRNWQIALGVVAVLVLVVVIPVLARRPAPRMLYGPSLSDIKYTEVVFRSGKLRLAGMLILPQEVGPFPVVVFIHGAGTSRRDNPWYLSFARYFQEKGIAVLLPDKRGSERSEGRWQEAGFFDLADDVLAALEYLKAQDVFDYSAIGIAGMSQGGWVAPIAAARDQDIAFVIDVSGSAVSSDEQLYHEELNTIHNFGVYRFLARAIAPISAWSIKKWRQKELWDRIGGFDPLPYWGSLDVPVFVAYGEKDEHNNVPVAESARRLRRLGKSNITVKVYREADHAIEDPRTHRVQEELLEDLVEFIRRATRTSSGR